MRSLVAVFAIALTSSLYAADVDVSAFGLDNLEQMTEAEGNEVRGLGAMSWGVSSVSAWIPRHNISLNSSNGYRAFGQRKAGGESMSQIGLDLKGSRHSFRWNNCLPRLHYKTPRVKFDGFEGGFSNSFSL